MSIRDYLEMMENNLNLTSKKLLSIKEVVGEAPSLKVLFQYNSDALLSLMKVKEMLE